MKIIFTLTFALFASQAMALETVKNKRMSKKELIQLLQANQPASSLKNPPQLKKSATEITPIRQGQLKAEVYRTEIVDNGDGSFSYSFGSHCIGTVPTNVYDLRGVPAATWPDGPLFSCAGDSVRGAVEIKVTGNILLTDGKVFSDETPSEVKTAYGHIWVYEGAAVIQGDTNLVSVRGLATPSMITQMGSWGNVTCVPTQDGTGDVICTPAVGIFYSVQVEYLD